MTRISSIIIILVILLIPIFFFFRGGNGNYKISVWGGETYNVYYAKSITKETEKCVEFINSNDLKQRVCGENLSIEKIN